jgi:hypothetical protein
MAKVVKKRSISSELAQKIVDAIERGLRKVTGQ